MKNIKISICILLFILISITVYATPEIYIEESNSGWVKTDYVFENDYNGDLIPDVISNFTWINDTTIEVYVQDTVNNKQAYKWSSAVCDVDGIITKDEYNPSTDIWTNTGNLAYSYLEFYGLPDTWCEGGIGHILFGAGSGDKRYRLHVPEDSNKITFMTGQGTEEAYFVYQNEKSVIFDIGNGFNVTANLYWDINGDGSDWTNSVNDLFVDFDEDKWKFGATNNATDGIERYKYIIESNAIMSKKNGNYMFDEYTLNLDDICTEEANCTFNEYTKNGKYYIEIIFYSGQFIDPYFKIDTTEDDETIHADEHRDCTEITQEQVSCTYSSEQINIKNKDGIFDSCDNVLDYNIDYEKISFDFGQQQININYEYNYDINPFLIIDQNKCSFYFTLNEIDQDINVSELKLYIPDGFDYIDNKITDGYYSINFNQALTEQNITITDNGTFITITGEDVDNLDPEVVLDSTDITYDGTLEGVSDSGDSISASGTTATVGSEYTGDYHSYRYFMEWNITDIPDSAVSIDVVNLQLRLVNTFSEYTTFSNITSRPTGLTASQLWTATSDTAIFNATTNPGFGIMNFTFNSAGKNEILNSLSKDWFGVVMRVPDGEEDDDNLQTVNTKEAFTAGFRPVLYVTYSAGGDTNPPTWSSPVNTSDNFWQGETFTANISMADENSLDVYIFSTNASGTWTNYTTDISGASYDASETKDIEVVGQICWYYWMNDTAGNTNQTDTFCFTSDYTPRITVNIDSPLNGGSVIQNEFTNFLVNLTCFDNDCSNIDTSLYYKITDLSDVIVDTDVDSGTYTGTGCNSPTDGYDGNFLTEAYADSYDSCTLYFNYTKPNSDIIEAIVYAESAVDTDYGDVILSCWNYTSSSFKSIISGYFDENITIPLDCLLGNNVQFKVFMENDADYYAEFYDSKMYWINDYQLVPNADGWHNIFTTANNPNSTSLTEGQSVIITYPINFSSDIGTNYTFYANSTKTDYTSVTNISSNINVTVQGQPIDDIYPIFSNLDSNNNTFNDTGTAILNVTVENTNGTVGVEFNGVNYTATQDGSTFNVSIPIVSSGSYNYYWWAYGNGTENNYNTTDTFVFYVGTYVAPSNATLILDIYDRLGNPVAYYYSNIIKFNVLFQLWNTDSPPSCSSEVLGSKYYDISMDNECICRSTNQWTLHNGTICT